MKTTANQIRAELKVRGLKASVRCLPGYTIAVTTEDLARVKPVALQVYHRQPHSWLCIMVNHNWLPMPPIPV